MNDAHPDTPFGWVIFCDDVRSEVGNKQSYMGVYRADIILRQQFPATLSKFVIAIHYCERPDEGAEPLELLVYFPGDQDDKPSFTAQFPADRHQLVTPDPENSPDPLLTTVLHAEFSPFRLQEEGRIKVRVRRQDGSILKLGALIVRGQTRTPDPAV